MSPKTPAEPPQPQAGARAATELAAVLVSLEHALDRARRAQQLVARDAVDRNAELALAAAILDLDRVRNRILELTR